MAHKIISGIAAALSAALAALSILSVSSAQAAPVAPQCNPESWFELGAQIVGANELLVTVRNVSDITTPISRFAFWADDVAGVLFYEGYVDVVPMHPGEYVQFPVVVDIYSPLGAIRAWYEWQSWYSQTEKIETTASCEVHRVYYWRAMFTCAFVNSAANCDGSATGD